MNTIFIVLPILTVLMFDLGLTLEGKYFLLVIRRYKAVLAGMIGQLVAARIERVLSRLAFPALMMNVVLLCYVGVIKLRNHA